MVPNHSIYPSSSSSSEAPTSPLHSSSSLSPSLTPNKHHQTSSVHLSQLLPFPSSNTTLVNMNINNHHNNNNSKNNNVFTNHHHGHTSNKIWKASLITNISSSGNHLVSLSDVPDCRKNE